MPSAPKFPRDPPSSDKLMQTFRLPGELVRFLKAEAVASGKDLTAYVTRMLEGIQSYYGLPQAAIHHLEQDRAAMGLDRHQYLLHLAYIRSMQIIQHGPGFDAPGKLLQQKK